MHVYDMTPFINRISFADKIQMRTSGFGEFQKMSKHESNLTPFVERKARAWYRLTNANKTGYMDRADFNKMADTFISEFELGEKQGAEIRAWLVDGWEALINQIKPDTPGKPPLVSQESMPFTFLVAEKIANGDKINEELYLNAYQEVLNINKNLFPTVLTQMVSSFFDVFDTDSDGYITAENMIRGLKCFGIDKPDALTKVFAGLDTAGKGKIDKDTYAAAWVEFMTGSDEDAPMAKYLKV